eukprot:s87_g6.t1
MIILNAVRFQQDVQQEEQALVTGDCWQVDPLRRERIRHRKDKKQFLCEMTRSPAPPIPKHQLLDDRETHIEYKDGTKVLHKDNWKAEKKFSDNLDGPWKGKTVYKIKDDDLIPDDVVKTDIERNAKRLRGSIDDVFQPEQPFPSQPSSVQRKPSSSKKEAHHPPKPVVIDHPEGADELDRMDKEMGTDDLEPVEHPAPSAPARRKQDSESQIQKLGSDALEPRRLSVSLPGSEVQVMTPAFKKMLRKLEEIVELYKLHVKHDHMSRPQVRRRTSMLGLPDSVYEKYENVVNKCHVCSTSAAPPPRARVLGIRSSNFGDVIFVDQAEITLRKIKYIVLLVLDGDEAFFQEDFLTYYRTHGIKECPCGSRTPWPNRAESAVRLFKRQWQILVKSLEDDQCKAVTIREAVKHTVWARSTQLTISGYSPLEIVTGHRPPDLLNIETSDPAQLSVEPLAEDRIQLELQRLALKAHQEARQAADLRHDMAKRTMPCDGPYKPGEKVFVWMLPANASSIASKANKKERWIRGTVIPQEGAMVNIHVGDAVIRVNQSKVRRDHDEWRDVAVPGLDNPDPAPLALEDEDDY